MIYITGDTHGRFSRILKFCEEHETTVDDILIILGDAGINYWEDSRDTRLKKKLAQLPITIFCIYGNHEQRPEKIETYKYQEWQGGLVLYEKDYPNIKFAVDSEIYQLNGKEYIAIGGAYSVDKFYRLAKGYKWFEDEQPCEDVKEAVEFQLESQENQIYGVLSHTCPLKYEPVEVFLPGIDQSSVDKSTEEWLDMIEDSLNYDKWYCGHYHTDKSIDKLRFMFEDIKELQ